MTTPRQIGRVPGNPIANAITLVLGALALGAALVFGFVLVTGFLIAVAVFVSFVSLRLWWASRRFGRRHGRPATGGGSRRAHGGRGTVIEAEYRVVREERRDG